MESLEGHFLVASPGLLDPNFAQTIVLMIQHNDQGALGLVLNRPSSKSLAELWEEVGGEACGGHRSVYLGGPVPGPLMALHAAPDLAELDVCDGVYFSARKEHLDQLVAREDVPMKMFVGHAGWAPGQLEKELELGGWVTVGGAAGYVFGHAPDAWQRLLQEQGHRPPAGRLAELLHIPNPPPDPSVN